MAQSELFAMLCERWAPTNIPLLVLACSCNHTGTSSSINSSNSSAIDIVRSLRLGRLGRRWMVEFLIIYTNRIVLQTQCGDVETLTGIRNGFHWLLNESVGSSLFTKAR